MVGVHGHAQRPGALRVERVTNVQRLLHGVYASPLSGLHGVQGLDGQRHAHLAGVLQCFGDAAGYFIAGAGDVDVLRLAAECTG